MHAKHHFLEHISDEELSRLPHAKAYTKFGFVVGKPRGGVGIAPSSPGHPHRKPHPVFDPGKQPIGHPHRKPPPVFDPGKEPV